MRPRRLKNEINVVPYIDVMLVLLVIFMVTAPMLPTGSVDLPSVQKASQNKDKAMEVTIKADGSLALTDRAGDNRERALTKADLKTAVAMAQEKNPDQPVLIVGDKNIKYENVLTVMDDLKQIGVKRLSLQVQPVGR